MLLPRFLIGWGFGCVQALAGIEPSLLKEKFLTEQDKIIQETDRPERLQLRMPSRGEARYDGGVFFRGGGGGG